MKNKTTFLISLLFFISISATALTQPILCNGKQIWGNFETISLPEKNIKVEAKLDTGASMASISANDIHVFKNQNQDWVRFTLYLPRTHQKIIFTKPLIGQTFIRNRKEEINNKNNKMSSRYVINLEVSVGNQHKIIQVNLADRREFRYPLLLGREALKAFNVLVDVSQSNLVTAV